MQGSSVHRLWHRRARATATLAAAILVDAAWLCLPAGAYAVPTYQVPTAISSDCSVDVTQPILTWIASVPDDSVLSFGPGACYRIDGTLELTRRHGLDFEGHGATFRATTRGGTWRSQWRLVGGSDLRFRNMSVQGANPAGGTFVSDLQHQHAWELVGVDDVEIAEAHVADAYGDCVYVGQGWDPARSWSSNIHVHASTCTRNGRMGVAVVAGRDVRVETTTFSQIARTVFDIEPNGTGFGAQNVIFTNNQVTGPLPGGFFSAIGDGPVNSVTVSNNRAIGVGMYMAVFAPPGQRRSNVTIAGNISDTGHYAPGSAALDFERVDGLTVIGNTIPVGGPNMALASALESCHLRIFGNGFPGGVKEARIAPYSCGSEPPPGRPPATNKRPIATVTAPTEGSAFSSRLVIRADARDDRAVARVEFWANGKLLHVDRSPPYSYRWSLPKRTPVHGPYRITVKAFDGSGASARDSVTVTRLASTSTTLVVYPSRSAAVGSSGGLGTRYARGRVRGPRSGSIALRLERFDRTTQGWVEASTRRLRLGRHGTFGARLRGLERGRWRVRARFAGSDSRARSHSSYRYFRIH